MEKLKNMVDVSSFMLFEATGDSETYSEDDELNLKTDMNDDDDAQSCSYDSMDCGSILELNGVSRDHLRHTHVKVHHQQADGDDDVDDDGGGGGGGGGEVIDQRFSGGHYGGVHDRVDDGVVLMSTARAGKHKKLRVCGGDSNMELRNEVEESRLFWEACLAS